MKMRKKISWLLSFFMVFSLFMGSAGMIVKADGQKAVVKIARQDSTATGTVYYKWDTAAEWTEVNQTAYNNTPIEINRPDDSLDHTVHFKVVCGTDTIINHCQVNKNGVQDASLDKNILTSEGGQAFSVSASEQVELILEFRTEASGGGGSTTGPASGETIAVTATAVGGAIGDLKIDGMRIGSGMGTNISGSFAGDKTQRHRVAIAADFGYAFTSITVNGTAIPLGGTTDNLEFEVAPADSYQIEVALTTNSSRNYNIVWAPSLTVAEQHGFGNDCVIEHGSVENINDAAHMLGLIDSAMNKLESLENAEYIDQDGKDITPASYDITFQDVSFGYDKRTVLHDVNFTIPQNTTTAIVGPSGSGKSTLCSLIARFYDVDAGKITFGGTDIREFTCDSLLKNISMVFQNVYLFRDTIRNNIKFGSPDASEEQIIAAAKKARCHDFIMALPDGYDTVIGEGGSSLSGGEKQRISIARAMLKDAPIVILDEATASIDPENEHLIQEAISALTHGKTIITIAHRLATIENADQILVIDGGTVVQKGTHKELLKQRGTYQDFIRIREQAEGWRIQQ